MNTKKLRKWGTISLLSAMIFLGIFCFRENHKWDIANIIAFSLMLLCLLSGIALRNIEAFKKKKETEKALLN